MRFGSCLHSLINPNILDINHVYDYHTSRDEHIFTKSCSKAKRNTTEKKTSTKRLYIKKNIKFQTS